MQYNDDDDNVNITIPSEFSAVRKVLEMGAVKHGANSWLEPDVFTMKRTQSQLRHLLKKTGLWTKAHSYLHISYDRAIELNQSKAIAAIRLHKAIEILLEELEQVNYNPDFRLDDESGLPHTLHEACNALMFYTLEERGLLKSKEQDKLEAKNKYLKILGYMTDD